MIKYISIKAKVWIARLLSNSFTSALLRRVYGNAVPDRRWSGFEFEIPDDCAAPETRSQIYFGFYESAEIRLVESLLPSDSDVIELGASLGIVSSHIARKLDPGVKLLCVEANPQLITTIRRNVKRHMAARVDFHVVNRAVGVGQKTYGFDFHIDHTGNRRCDATQSECQQIPACTLSSLLAEFSIKQFNLVCDIEGAEIDILLNDFQALNNCKAILIELHPTNHAGREFPVEDLKKIIIDDLNFEMIENKGSVCYFRKPS